MIDPVSEVRGFFRAALLDPVERAHAESPEALVQRRWISSVTLAVGSFMMAWTLRLAPGAIEFYAASLALATTWIVGGTLSGRLYLGQSNTRSGGQSGRGVLHAVILGLILLAVFLGGAVLVAPVPYLRAPLLALLSHADAGMLPVVALITALTSVGEELFFRGALYAAVGGRQALLVTTLVYALATIPTGQPLLVIAAGIVGWVTGLQRRATGGVLAPLLTHLVWSMGLLLLLPLALGA